jgi:hypothetical protein
VLFYGFIKNLLSQSRKERKEDQEKVKKTAALREQILKQVILCPKFR